MYFFLKYNATLATLLFMIGRLITFEGIDGAGKSVQLELLKNYLLSKKIPFISVREPGSTDLGEDIRLMVLNHNNISSITEALLFFAARAELISKKILPALTSGTWVLCDRFYDSTLIYQGSLGGCNVEHLMLLKEIVVGSLEPDLTFVLTLPPQIAYKRVMLRSTQLNLELANNLKTDEVNKFDTLGIEYYEKLHDAYLKLSEAFSFRTCVIKSNRPPEKIHDEIISTMRNRFPDFTSNH